MESFEERIRAELAPAKIKTNKVHHKAGELLSEAKNHFTDNGEWEAWLKRTFKLTPKVANDYILDYMLQAAESYRFRLAAQKESQL